MLVNNIKYKTIWLNSSKKVIIIDQTLLPFNFKEVELKTLDCVINAIVEMQVRGAPLIGVTAAFGIYLAVKSSNQDNHIVDAGKRLVETRPTAINLNWAVNRIIKILLETSLSDREEKALSVANIMWKEDQEINEKIGIFGAEEINKIYKKIDRPVNILTHCNAGWLATVDWGTATAPIYKARDMGIPLHVWVDETRPRNQGSYLTAFELKHEFINHTIITDNTGGHLMQNGLVDLVITGSDRTTYTGDVCNKIGTYLKALAAYDNDIPFYVALPSSTIDWDTNNGNQIKIEKRDENEVHYIKGVNEYNEIQNIRVTPKNTKAANYAFDVTPRKYITSLITEFGLIEPNENKILDIKKIKK